MTSPAEPVAGLCAQCTYGRRIVSGRGSRFWRCRLSDADARFLRYPSLPVLACDGYRPLPDASEDE